MFNNLQDTETLYWLGLIAADGWIEERKGEPASLGIKLKREDEYLLYQLKEFLGTKANVRQKKDGNTELSVLVAGGKNTFIPQLIALGITPRKTKTLKLDTRLVGSKHFWRGFIDGDGSFYGTGVGQYRYVNFELGSSSKDLIEQFRNFLADNGMSKHSLTECRGFYRVRMGHCKTLCLAATIYGNNCNPYMKRKEEFVHSFLTNITY